MQQHGVSMAPSSRRHAHPNQSKHPQRPHDPTYLSDDRKLYDEWQRRLSERPDAPLLPPSKSKSTPPNANLHRSDYSIGPGPGPGPALAAETLFPPGTLHVWIYQARHLVFRRLFETMFARHGLRLRVYLESRTTSDLSEIYETPRNGGGNMANPRWRLADDDARDNRNGHFAIRLDRNTLRSDPELVLEIVCGIVVVAHTKVSLVQLLLGTFGTSPAFLATQNVQFRPHWFPLAGEDSGVVEIALEFISTTLVREHQVQPRNQQVEEATPDDSDTLPVSAAALARRRGSTGSTGAVDPIAMHQAQRRARFELLETPGSNVTASGVRVQTPPRRTRPVRVREREHLRLTRPSRFNVEFDDLQPQQEQTKSTSSFVRPDELAMLSASMVGSSENELTPEEEIDQQVCQMYEYGLSDVAPEIDSSSSMDPDALVFARTNSVVSMDSNSNSTRSFAMSDASEASAASFATSSCVSDVLTFNDRIQRMEEVIRAEQERRHAEQQQQQKPAAPTPVPIATVPVSDNQTQTQSQSQLQMIPERRKPGVILFDPSALRPTVLPLHSASMQSAIRNPVSAAAAQRARMMIGRRRSLPVNTLFPRRFPPSPVKLFAGKPLQTRVQLRAASDPNLPPLPPSKTAPPTWRQVLHDQSKDDLDLVQPSPTSASYRHRRTSSLTSITDLLKDPGSSIHNVEVPSPKKSPPTPPRSTPPSVSFTNHNKSTFSLISSASNSSSNSSRSSERSSSASMQPVPTVQPSGSRPRVRRNSRGLNEVQINGVPLGPGQFVNVGHVPGVIRFIGQTLFAPGLWIGLELCERKGKHNGTVQGVPYFSCGDGHGIFIRAERLDISVQP